MNNRNNRRYNHFKAIIINMWDIQRWWYVDINQGRSSIATHWWPFRAWCDRTYCSWSRAPAAVSGSAAQYIRAHRACPDDACPAWRRVPLADCKLHRLRINLKDRGVLQIGASKMLLVTSCDEFMDFFSTFDQQNWTFSVSFRFVPAVFPINSRAWNETWVVEKSVR